MTPGLHKGIPAADYHAAPGLSHSGARLILDTPARYHYERTHPTPPTDAMEEGTCLHSLVLEGETVWDVVDGGRGVTERKAAVRAAGRIPLSADRAAVITGMADALAAHPEASDVLATAPDREISATVEDPTTGTLLRCRYDALAPLYAADVKTTRSIAEFDAGRPLVTYGYAMQAAWYLEVAALLGQPRDAFLFVLVEKDPPHLVAVRELDDDSLTYGRILMRRAVDLYAKCQATDTWPGPTPYQTISVPVWALRQEGIA